MLSFLRRKRQNAVQPPLRGVLPTYVTNDTVILSKAGPVVRNTYEIRLALFLAKSKNLTFTLSVKPEADVETSVVSLLKQHGGEIARASLDDYSVYFGHAKLDGEEEGWVLGNAIALAAFHASISSAWLRSRLFVGANFIDTDLANLESVLRTETSSCLNVDGENAVEAIKSLVTAAKESNGVLFVQ